MSLFLPREHGAWGVLLIPFVTTAIIARRADAPVLLCFAAAFLFYLARHPLELLLAPQAQRYYRGQWPQAEHDAPLFREPRTEVRIPAKTLRLWFAVYTALGTVVVLLLLAAIAAAFFVLRIVFLRLRAERSLAGEWLAIPGLTLTAPAAWVAAIGTLDAAAVLLWLLHALFFSGGVFYVKFRIRVLRQKQSLGRLWERVVFARDLITYHLLMLVFAASVVHISWATNWQLAPRGPAHWAGWLAVLPFLPAAVRALVRVAWLGGWFEIKRLGWTEVAHSLVFGVLLVLTFRLKS